MNSRSSVLGARRSPLRRFVGCAGPYWKHLTVSLVATAGYVGLSAALIWLAGPLIGTLFGSETVPTQMTQVPSAQGFVGMLASVKDSLLGVMNRFVIRPDRTATLWRLCVAIALISLLKNLLRYSQMIIVAFVQQRVIRSLRDRMFAHFHDLSIAYFTRTRSGQIISRVGHDVLILNNMLDVGFNRLFRDPLMILALFASLFIISWKLTLIAMIVLPLSVGVMALAGRYIRRYSRRSQERMADLSSILEESVGGVRVVKAFGMEHYEVRRFADSNFAYFRATLKMLRVRHLNSPINEFLGTLASVAILWYGGSAVLAGAGVAPSEFMTFIFLMFSLIQPIKSLANVHAMISQGEAAATRVFEVLDTPVDVVDHAGARPLSGFGESIAYRGVGFRYDTGPWVLRNIDLEIPRGTSVALVGPSGGGKSTLCDLLARFYDPQEGSLTIDGTDIREFTTASIRAQLGIVTQDVILFHDTVTRNIAYGCTDVDPDRLRRAAEAANALGFIEALPGGFDTVIGPRGITLSGGQRQRLAVARAIYKDPPILIFDEATSALDTESETAVQRAIDNLLRDRTALIVAHRLSTVRNADKIAVVDNGQIVEVGSHDDLMAHSGLYRRLYEMQFADQELTRGPHEPPRPLL